MNHLPVPAGALKGVKKRVVSFRRIGEEVDVGSYVVVDDERKVGLGRRKVGLRLGHDVRINYERDFLGGFGRSVLGFGSEAVPLAKGFHLEAVDLVDHPVELILQIRRGLDVHAAGKHQIHGSIKVPASGEKIALLIVSLPRRVGFIDLLDESLYALLLSG